MNMPKVSIHVNLRSRRRLTWVKTFYCFKFSACQRKTLSYDSAGLLEIDRLNGILGWSKLKAFADDDNFKVAPIMKYFFDRLENIVGKGENADISIFSQCFQKASFSWSWKQRIVSERVQEHSSHRSVQLNFASKLILQLNTGLSKN